MSRHDFDPDDVVPDGRLATRSKLFDATAAGPWRGVVAGGTLGGPVTILAYGTDEIGAGPRWHVHPYDETFLVIEGRAKFFVGNTVVEVGAGEVVLGPMGLPHRFENLGPGRLQTIDIHHATEWVQTDIDQWSV
ncbi:cupin domain-containing protein [Frigidibacter oleivorans]|uniref:cupin domain-containing protein n=1 Tax=Frigidibacter oleivorans TaxID=2487129 RepID=UPI000F8C78F2|nr:cupin domain-containing protein [Frigidibacter oleivorans]